MNYAAIGGLPFAVVRRDIDFRNFDGAQLNSIVAV